MTITLPRGATAPPKPTPAPTPPPAPKPPPPPAFDPANGRYGDWPTRTDKPTLRRGAKGDAVRYLQGVISNKAGGNITVDGNFGPQTEARVKDCQRLIRAKTSGIVGKQVWTFIDILSK
jgi:peptidoglycan hydrolase-like protein with peptidoglycan-binding domain